MRLELGASESQVKRSNSSAALKHPTPPPPIFLPRVIHLSLNNWGQMTFTSFLIKSVDANVILTIDSLLYYSFWRLNTVIDASVTLKFNPLLFLQLLEAEYHGNSITYFWLDPPLVTRLIRFNPQSSRSPEHVCMRVEIYGCFYKSKESCFCQKK